MANQIRVRTAPSPTGPWHVGNAQSALYNWLLARKSGGTFHLRIEDTDKARSTKESEKDIIESMKWLGLDWDGDISHSSDNALRYKELLERLLKEGKAFYCHHSQEELETERKEQEAAKEPPIHVCEFKNSEKGKESDGIIRLKVEETSERIISFDDQIRGRVEFKQSLLGDFSIARAVDDALYHFAVTVDDIDMNITHVIRGEDHISNTPKHILIYEALELPVPIFAHLPLLLGPDRSKLSKRHGGTAVSEYKKDYLPEALINFLGTLGYTFSKEILTKEEMAEEFELAKVHRSGAMFDIKKLNWMNSQYINKLSTTDFKDLVGRPEIPDAAIPLITERLEKLSDINNFDYFWREPEYDRGLLKWKTMTDEELKKSLTLVKETLEPVDWKNFDKEKVRKTLDDLAKENFAGDRGMVYWPLRVALTGREGSPDPIELLSILDKEIVLKRIDAALEK